MRPVYQLLICYSLLFFGMQGQVMGQAETSLLSGVLDFQPNGEVSVLKVFCKNHSSAPFLLNYELEITHRQGQELKEQQEGGSFDIKARQKYLLALHTYDYKPSDHLNVILKVFSSGDLVAIDSLVILPKKNKLSPEILNLTNDILKKKKEASVEELIATANKPKPTKTQRPSTSAKPKEKSKSIEAPIVVTPKKQKIPAPVQPKAVDRVVLPQEEIGIDGLIIDETRSKMAHDFYDLFYRKWIPPQGVSDFIIYIRELPSRGRISRVAMAVNDDIILQRNLSPRYDLLEQQVNLAIRVLTRHLKKKESVKDQLGNEDAMGSGIF